jgi:hypothetical protein
MTAPATYTFIVTDIAEQDAKAAHAARTAHDDWRINAEGTVGRARIQGHVVWVTRTLHDSKPVVYVTHQQASALGLCHCGKPAEYIGFEGLRCGAHSKGGMSYLCSTTGCTKVSETGFSAHCKECTTPREREAREARNAAARAQYSTNTRYGRIGWQMVTGNSHSYM